MADANVIPQAPIPPFYREVKSGVMQTLTGAGAITLSEGATFLNSISAGPYALTMPAGNYKGQVHRIMVQGGNLPGTATFNLTGTFASPIVGFTFHDTSHSLTLEWDGFIWHNTGGNAEPTF